MSNLLRLALCWIGLFMVVACRGGAAPSEEPAASETRAFSAGVPRDWRRQPVAEAGSPTERVSDGGLQWEGRPRDAIAYAGRPRRANYSARLEVVASSPTGGAVLGLTLRGEDGGGRQGYVTFWFGQDTCVVESVTHIRGQRIEATHPAKCARPTEAGTVTLGLQLHSQERTMVAYLNGEPAAWFLADWPPQAALTPLVEARFTSNGTVRVSEVSISTSQEEYFSRSFDEDFRTSVSRSPRWTFLAADPLKVEGSASVGGPGGFHVRARSKHSELADAGVLRSRAFVLGRVDLGATYEITEQAHSGIFLRFAAESYWRRHIFEIGIVREKGQPAHVYCAGLWDDRFNFEPSPHPLPDGSTLRATLKIHYEPRTGVATASVDDHEICARKSGIPPLLDANLELGANLLGADSNVAYRVERAWFHK